jgi:hypothetical protein
MGLNAAVTAADVTVAVLSASLANIAHPAKNVKLA